MLGEQSREVSDAVLVRTEPGPLATLFAGDESRVGENFQVVADGRLRQTDGFIEVAGAAFTGGADEGEQLQPGGFGDSFEDLGQVLCVGSIDGADRPVAQNAAGLTAGALTGTASVM